MMNGRDNHSQRLSALGYPNYGEEFSAMVLAYIDRWECDPGYAVNRQLSRWVQLEHLAKIDHDRARLEAVAR